MELGQCHSCYILTKNSALFCPCPEHLSKAKLKNKGLMWWKKFKTGSIRLWNRHSSLCLYESTVREHNNQKDKKNGDLVRVIMYMGLKLQKKVICIEECNL